MTNPSAFEMGRREGASCGCKTVELTIDGVTSVDQLWCMKHTFPRESREIKIKNFHCSKHGYIKPVPKCPKCNVPPKAFFDTTPTPCCEKCDCKLVYHEATHCGNPACDCHTTNDSENGDNGTTSVESEERKCICGQQTTFGNADVEIGGICHRTKRPCYVVAPTQPESWYRDIEHIAMNIVHQIGDALYEALPRDVAHEHFVKARQATNDMVIDFAAKLITEAISSAREEGRQAGFKEGRESRGALLAREHDDGYKAGRQAGREEAVEYMEKHWADGMLDGDVRPSDNLFNEARNLTPEK